MPKPHSLSPAACLELLQLHSEGLLTLTVVQFDDYLGKVLEVLETANNEKFRLRGGPESDAEEE